MMRIDQIWEELESDTSSATGLLLRRYAGSVLPDIFIALKFPEKIRCLVIAISHKVPVDISHLADLRDISIELSKHFQEQEKKYLILKLLNYHHQDVFSVLAEDLIFSISTVSEERHLVKELLNRFEKWKSLFNKINAAGLTNEEQQGLYGELFLLRQLLENSSDYSGVINSWVGNEKQMRDFQAGPQAVEVKTTHGNNHQKVHISSERQLDASNLDNLFLYHLSVEIRQQSGETLNDIVLSVSDLLSSDTVVLNRFKSKLLEGGYFEHQTSLYANHGYIVRDDAFYKVYGNFPRIEEKDIRKGVGDIVYSVILSNCTEYIVSRDSVFNTLNFS